MVNIVVCQDFGLEFLAKAKPLRPRPQNLAIRSRPRTNIITVIDGFNPSVFIVVRCLYSCFLPLCEQLLYL